MHADEDRQKVAADGQQTDEGYDERWRWQGQLMDWVNPGEIAGMQTRALRLMQIEEEGSKRLDNDERLLRVMKTGGVLKLMGDDCRGLDWMTTDDGN